MSTPRLRSFGLLALVATFVVGISSACGGDKTQAPTPTPGSVVKHRAEALVRSSASAAQATSFAASFHADITTDNKHIEEDGTIAFQAPSSMHMTMSILGQEVEILALLPDEYINVPGMGWYSLGDAVINRDAYASYAKNRGPVDYSGVVDALKDSEILPDAAIDGISYDHYRGSFNVSDALDKIPQDLFKPGVADLVKQLTGQDGDIEVWIDPSTGLPRRFTMAMEINVAGSAVQTVTTMNYLSWNQPVEIPAAPTDAKPYSDLTGGLGPTDLAYMGACGTWLQSFAKHLEAFPDLPDYSKLTSDERARIQDAVTTFNDDFDAFHALQPTERFQPSYDKFSDAMDGFKVLFDGIDDEINGRGRGDEQAIKDRAEAAGTDFQEAAKLFRSEQPTPR